MKRVLQNLNSLQRGKKQQMQSKLAIARATAHLAQHDREQRKKACQGFDCPTLVQKIVVRVRGGESATRMSPMDCEDDRNEKEHTFDQTASVAAWIATATEEQKLVTGHALVCPTTYEPQPL